MEHDTQPHEMEVYEENREEIMRAWETLTGLLMSECQGGGITSAQANYIRIAHEAVCSAAKLMNVDCRTASEAAFVAAQGKF